MIVGTCKIVSNDTGGKYTVTQVFLTPATPAFSTANVGLSSVAAVDVRLRDTGVAGTTAYPFMSVEAKDGGPVVVIDVSSDGTAALANGQAVIKTYVFDIQGDEAWADVDDTVNFNNTLVLGAAVYDAGAPVSGGSPVDDDAGGNGVEWRHAPSGATWLAQTPGSQSNNYITGNTFVAKDIMRIVGYVRGDFHLRAGTDGALQAKSENFANRWHVLVSLWSSGTMPTSDPIVIT